MASAEAIFFWQERVSVAPGQTLKRPTIAAKPSARRFRS